MWPSTHSTIISSCIDYHLMTLPFNGSITNRLYSVRISNHTSPTCKIVHGGFLICSQWITTFVTWISLFMTTYNVFALYVTPSPFPLLLLFHPRRSYILFHASLLLRNNLLLNISECKLNKLHAQTPVVSCPMCVQITRRSAESLESYFAPLLKPHLKQLRLLPILHRIKCKFNLNHP